MMPMFLTVYLSNNEQHFSEVPIMPETLCRDVVELCKEPGEAHCYLAETWRGSERVVGEGERILEALQRWGHQKGEVRYLLRHQKPPGRETGVSRAADQVMKRNQTKAAVENGGLSVGDLQDLAVRQQQQIDVQQKLLASKEQRLWSLQQQAEVSEQQKLQQEAKLRRVRALRGRVEQKRLSNSKLVEEVQQLSGFLLLQQKELQVAAARVEELSEELEELRRSNRKEPPPLPPPPLPPPHPPLPHPHPPLPHLLSSSAVELEHLYKELQRRRRLNEEQSGRLQQQREGLSRRAGEAAAMERRLVELRQRLRKKKAALQKENLPADPLLSGGSRVAAVGPYMQAPQGPPDGPLKPPPRPSKPAAGFSKLQTFHEGFGRSSTLPRMSGSKPLTDQTAVSDVPPPVPSRTNHNAESNNQGKSLPKMAAPPPLPSKSKPPSSSRPPFSTGTFPGKVRPSGGPLRAAGGPSTLPLPHKQESPRAAAVRPFTPDPPAPLQRPQSSSASSIYSMYTQQGGYQQGGTLPRSQPRVYGKPVFSSSSSSSSAVAVVTAASDELDDGCQGDAEAPAAAATATERAPPRPLSPTKLLPFLSSLPHRCPGDADPELPRRRLHHAPRPLKKRSSITEPEGPAGPNIQKLLYQKTTLAAMETVATETPMADCLLTQSPEEPLTPPPLPPRCPAPDSAPLPPPLEDKEEEEEAYPSAAAPQDYFTEEFPPYPPPPYPAAGDGDHRDDGDGDHRDDGDLQPPEVTGQVTAPPGKRTILRKSGSQRMNHGRRVKFNPLALLLDASLEGEYDLVQRVVYEVDDPSAANDEGITALHNAVCAGHTEIVKFLVQFGVNANAADSDGWTPLHCAASCNNVQVCKFLVESGAAVFATTHSDLQTAAEKCEEMEDGYTQCSQFLYGVQEKMGLMNRGVVYALWDFEPQSEDELGFTEGDCMTVLRRHDAVETQWWWARCGDREGYVPRNLLGLYLRIKQRQRSLA